MTAHDPERKFVVTAWTSRIDPKAEVAAAAKLACAYLGIQKNIKYDRDISDDEIIKYQEELTNMWLLFILNLLKTKKLEKD